MADAARVRGGLWLAHRHGRGVQLVYDADTGDYVRVVLRVWGDRSVAREGEAAATLVRFLDTVLPPP